jgi:hypothetical protein
MRYFLLGFFLLARLLSPAQVPNSTFLIPNNYKGLIFIFTDDLSSDTLPIIQNEILFKIPADGVLITKSKVPDYSILSFYYVDSSGKRIEIRENCGGRSEEDCTSMVKVEGARYEYHRSETDKHPIEYELIIIADDGTRRLIKSKSYQMKMRQLISKKLKRRFYFEYK